MDNLLDHYNDERSMSFYYIATTLVPVDLVSKAVNEMLTTYRGDDSDLKTKANSQRATIEDFGFEIQHPSKS